MERTWALVPDTLDYVSSDGLIAVYKHTHSSGYACYWTFKAGLPARERKQRNALAVGGLPDKRIGL